MTSFVAIQKGLFDFKLSGFAKTLEEKIEYAKETNQSYLEFIASLVEAEIFSRQNNSLKKRLQKSKVLQNKKLEDYDFPFQPSLNKMEILELANCSFIEKRENVLFFGKPGTGKTHLACAIGMKALIKGYKVLFKTAHDILEELHQSKADGTHYQKLNSYIDPDLLIVDEVGFKKFTQSGADDLFEIVNQRYEKKSTIMTSNKSFEDWAQVLFDPVLAGAIIDRLIHHCHIISIKGDSFRARAYKESKKDKTNSLQTTKN